MVATAEHREFVTSAYRLLLDRDPEPAGLKHWSESLANGLTTVRFLRAMISSAECEARLGGPIGDALEGVDLMLSAGGCRFVVPARDQSLVPYLLKDRTWEHTIVQYLLRVLTPADVFVDIGANLGYYTAILAPLVRQVIAFEPVNMSFEYCRRNVDLNDRRNVVLHNRGIWDRETDLEMTVDPSSLMTAHVGAGQPVHCVSLDQLDLDPTVIKIDIEGAEPFALRGMRRTLASLRPVVVMELNRPALARYGSDAGDIWNFFAGLDYDIAAFDSSDPDPTPVETLAALSRRCPADGLIDIAAFPRAHGAAASSGLR